MLCLDQAADFVLWLKPGGRFIYVNPALCRALEYSPGECRALSAWDISPQTPESWKIRLAGLKRRRADTFVAEWRSRSGGMVPVRINIKFTAVGRRQYLICYGHDLRESRTTSEYPHPTLDSKIPESSVDAIFVIDDRHVVDSNRGSKDRIREMIRHDLEMMLRESGVIHQRIARALHGEAVTFSWYSRRADGSRAHIECTLSRIRIERAARVLAIAVDVTSRRRSERTLAELSGRLLELQDEERRRIARDLHDTTGQHIAALSMHLSNMLASARPAAAEGLHEAIELADSCIRDVRAISYLLHPPLLDELGLESALRAYSEGYSERIGIQLDLHLPAKMRRMPQEVETTLFRIVQEGLANIHRHSGSRTALIHLKQTRDSVEMEVIDHGHGLPPGALESDAPSASRIGVGIAGMRERARQLGGRFALLSGETGTTLHVVLPLPAKAAGA